MGADAVAVDPLNNVLIVAGSLREAGKTTFHLLIFERTAQGNTKPLRVIKGPKTDLTGTFGVRAFPKKELFFVAVKGPSMSFHYDPSFVGVWSIKDNGDVPPRWRIGGPRQMLKQPRGIDIDEKNQAVLITDKVLNAVFTYSVPELF